MFRYLGTGLRVQGLRFGVRSSLTRRVQCKGLRGSRVHGSGFGDLGLRLQGAGFRFVGFSVRGVGLMVWGNPKVWRFRLRMEGLAFRVWD